MTMTMAVTESTPGVGRPRTFASPDELEQAVDAYFDSRTKDSPPTMAGLAMACGVSRQTLINYANDGRDRRYLDAITRARHRIEESLETGLYTKQAVAGFIFSLKNNFGWKDVQEIEHTHQVVLFNPEPPAELTFAPAQQLPGRNPLESLAITPRSHTGDSVNLQVIDSTRVDDGL